MGTIKVTTGKIKDIITEVVKNVLKVSDETHQSMIDTMSQNLDSQDNPKVGLFWFSEKMGDLFGVVAVDKDSYPKPNPTIDNVGMITCRELHQDIWRKAFNRQKYKNIDGPFVGDYKDTPRGRIFYSPQEDKYYVMVGEWINEVDYNLFIELIEDYFNLYDVNYTINTGHHWDIGVGWENR